MPLSGSAMLMTGMNIDPEHELDFNRWYDQEHLRERVAIPGFLEARRYVAISAKVKYLCLYTAQDFSALTGPAYRAVLANQTTWSLKNIDRLQDPMRAICRISLSHGQGRGSILGRVRIRPATTTAAALRTNIEAKFERVLPRDGIISLHLMESDPELSQPIGLSVPSPDAGDWYIMVDGSDAIAVEKIMAEEFRDYPKSSGTWISSDIYRLLWDLAKAELGEENA